jgi:hypothetical protein
VTRYLYDHYDLVRYLVELGVKVERDPDRAATDDHVPVRFVVPDEDPQPSG